MNPLLSLALPILLLVPALAQAALPSYTLTLHNGELTPQTLHVKAGERFKIELHNTGNTPVEFESTSLRKEKVMGARRQLLCRGSSAQAGRIRLFRRIPST